MTRPYEFAAIMRRDDPDPGHELLPRLSEDGGVALAPGESVIETFQAKKLTLHRGGVERGTRYFHVEKVTITVSLTTDRVIAHCRRYDKGGGWVGTPTAMVVANTVSKARAAARSHGKVLAGHLPLRWLESVGYMEKHSWTTDNKLRLIARDAVGGDLVIVDFGLPKTADPRGLAAKILDQAAQHRLKNGSHLDDDQRDALAMGIEIDAFDRTSGKFTLANVPGPIHAGAATAD